jgi:hypothetical protein
MAMSTGYIRRWWSYEALGSVRKIAGRLLHEDWADDYPDLWHAVTDFIDGEPEGGPRIAGEIAQVLADCNTEAALERALLGLGMIYHPPGDEWESYRAFLLAVAAHVEQNLHKSPAA